MEIFNRHTEERGAPRLSDAIATVGSVAAGVGILMISADVFDSSPGRPAPVALFAAFVVAGYAVLLWAPRSLRPAGITAIVVGILGALGWWWLPGASSMADVRPFLILTIVAMAVAFVVPRSRGRGIFVVIILLVLWLWAIAEIASPENAYSIAPIPSPPAHTPLSLAGFSAQVSLDDLDPSDPLYPIAEDCADGDMTACDDLYDEAPFGSDFSEFGGSCGDTFTGSPGFCDQTFTPPTFDFGDDGPPATFNPMVPTTPFTTGGDDKSFEIGFVSVLFGLAYLAALFVLDNRRQRGLATAFVVPAIAALVEGTSLLGNAADHAWVGGLLTVFAGVLVGAVGHLAGERRFTTWTGGLLIGFGALTIALDAVNIESSSSNGELKIAGPGLIVIGVGVALVACAFLAAQVLPDPDPDEPASGDPLPIDPPQPGPGGWAAPQTVGGGFPPPQTWNEPPPTAVPPSQWGAPPPPAPPSEPPPSATPPPDYGWGPPPAAPPARE